MTLLVDDIAADLAARIAGITVANGYRTDIGSTVFAGRRRLDDSHMPCAVIVEGEDTPTAQQPGKVRIEARYAVEGVAACDPDDPNDVGRAIVADIKQAIWGGDITFGRRVVSIDYRGRTIAPREDGAAMVSAAVEFSLSFAETLASGG